MAAKSERSAISSLPTDRAPTRRALVPVEALIGSYEQTEASSFQSWSHRHGAGGDLYFRRPDSVQSCSHRRGVGGEHHRGPPINGCTRHPPPPRPSLAMAVV